MRLREHLQSLKKIMKEVFEFSNVELKPMIKFFRHNRQRSVIENYFSKYLPHSLSESCERPVRDFI